MPEELSAAEVLAGALAMRMAADAQDLRLRTIGHLNQSWSAELRAQAGLSPGATPGARLGVVLKSLLRPALKDISEDWRVLIEQGSDGGKIEALTFIRGFRGGSLSAHVAVVVGRETIRIGCKEIGLGPGVFGRVTAALSRAAASFYAVDPAAPQRLQAEAALTSGDR